MNQEVHRLPPPRRRGWAAHLLMLAMALFAGAAAAQMKVVDGVLQEANGTPFVMRGVNVAHVWYRDKTAQTLKDLAARKANTVRLVLGNGVKWTKTEESEVRGLIEQSKAAKLIVMLEIHDTTGYGEQGGMSTLDQAANYWISIKNALIGQEDYVLVNIGNEPTGNGQPSSTWIDGHKNAIAKMRAAGIRNTLVVDAANWGQDWEGIMRSNAASVFASDSLRNTVFSVHMYAVYPTDSAVINYLSTFLSAKLPIIVGEFGDAFQGQPVAAGAIMSRARQYGIGYIGWSWSGNGGSDAALDIVSNFNGNSLSSWGNLLFNDTNGITATAKTATIFGGPTTELPGVPAASATAGNGQVTLSWDASSGATSYDVQRSGSAGGTFTTIVGGTTARTHVDSGLANGTTYYYRVVARNSAGSTVSSVMSATPTAGVTIPSAPNVSATSGNSRITLKWNTVASAQAYGVARALSANGSFSSIAALAADATGYTDTQVTNGVTYHYRVTASNSAGTSPAGTASATPAADPLGGNCTLTVDTSSDWGNSQVLRLTLANTGSSPINGWAFSFTESNDFSIQSSWNANVAMSGRTLNFSPAEWTRTIWPGGKVEAGLHINYAGSRPVPGNVSTQGLNCEVVMK